VDAAHVLDEVRVRPATLGAHRLLCIDGPSGAGKTTLAGAIARLAPEARVVHLDAMYDGWGGLPRLDTQLATLLTPLAEGRPGTYLRYDWHQERYAETVTVEPGPLLVLEGVGAWSPAYADLVTLLVWVDAPPSLRLARAVARDGSGLEDRLRAWALAEQEHFARTGARDHADVVIAP
jgi:uridine kinase